MTRTLVLIRHAKAEKIHPDGDHERELAERGVADAQALGRWLAEEELAPDLVLVSTATRTRQTADRVLEGAGASDAEQWPDRGIYTHGPEGVLSAVREADPEAGVLWVVGHEPSMSVVTLALADPTTSSGPALAGVRDHFPTATAAVLVVDAPWADLAEGMARLAAVHTARAELG
ncbi:SixA phosphatase family protein [Ornithinimicrobium tianjinense]|uniref:Phosphohistidine phosphatase n=1 Tax=Ornithinimicrobium tianjinense TaxID=1195761 RepID=A0A917BHJ0_9MICO|nr:histidine phosphatase family protein [Ornithinimicrobium tianjinense]GGF41698.1 phosphohistidine phosphatase [Ornithinimicrobium tianjinense]